MDKALVTVHLGRHFRIFGHYDYKVLLDMGYEVHIASNFNDNIDKFEDPNVIKHQINFNRNPLSIDNIKAIIQLKKIFKENNFQIIHTQSPIGGAVTRFAARKIYKKGSKLIYTAHGFHFFKGASIINWALVYPVERWLARYTDVIITINNEDYYRAKKSFKTANVKYIPGVGVDTRKFSNMIVDKQAKLKELGLPEGCFVVLSVGELNRNKNHEIVIKTIAKLNDKNVYYLVCGQGMLEEYLRDLIKHLGLEKQVLLLGYRGDIDEIEKISDIFVLPSFREGLSLALMEAMAIGLPIVCSKIRGNIDLIEEDKGGYLCEPNNVGGFSNAILKLIENPALREKLGNHNKEFVKKYDIRNVQFLVRDIYRGEKNKYDN